MVVRFSVPWSLDTRPCRPRKPYPLFDIGGFFHLNLGGGILLERIAPQQDNCAFFGSRSLLHDLYSSRVHYVFFNIAEGVSLEMRSSVRNVGSCDLGLDINAWANSHARNDVRTLRLRLDISKIVGPPRRFVRLDTDRSGVQCGMGSLAERSEKAMVGRPFLTFFAIPSSVLGL